jgi:hypothetical protein
MDLANKKKIISQLILMTQLLMMLAVSEAGSWMRSEGEHRYSAYAQTSSADRSWDRDGNDVTSSCTSKDRSLTHEYEYGYSYYHTLFGKISMANSECGGDKASGFGDIHLGVRGRLNLYKNGRTWEAIVIIPSGYDNTRSNRIGYGELGLELGLYGSNQLNDKSRLTYGSSLRFWAGAPADQLRARVGISHKQNLLWSYDASLSGNFSLNNGESSLAPSIDGDFESEFDVIRAQFGVSRSLSKRLKLGAGVFKNLWGRNTSQRQGIYINLGYVWGRR